MRALREDFPQLEDQAYLDYAGTAVPAKRQLEAVCAQLTQELLGNPHSPNPSSKRSTALVDAARRQVLTWLGTDESRHSVVFTAGCTASLKLVGELFPWRKGSVFRHTHSSHTSALGIRAYATAGGARVESVPTEAAGEAIDLEEGHGPALFAYPGESNFSGEKLPLKWCTAYQEAGWRVLLDAAALLPTAALDLDRHPFDFVVFSFHKLFGFPSGLGALVVSHAAGEELEKRYFGGGTVTNALATSAVQAFRPLLHERLEDGTVPFSSIAALAHGFAALDRLGGTEAIGRHTHALAQYLYKGLSELRHSNGLKVCRIFGKHELDDESQQGPILAMVLVQADGSPVGYSEVGRMASLCGIHIRTGCFCNVGECHARLGLSEEDVRTQMAAGHVCWDDLDVVDGRPTGAIRVSLGYPSIREDCDRFIGLLRRFFLDGKGPEATLPAEDEISEHAGGEVRISGLCLFPLKSCGGFEVQKWPLGPQGLLYDREWAVVGTRGAALSCKTVPELLRLHPTLDLSNRLLRVAAERFPSIELSLDHEVEEETRCTFRVFGTEVAGHGYGDEVDAWCSRVVGQQVRLLRKTGAPRACNEAKLRAGQQALQVAKSVGPAPAGATLGLSNESQLLLLNEASVEDVRQRIAVEHQQPGLRESSAVPEEELATTIRRFRANVVIRGAPPFHEDTWENLSLAGLGATCLGPCARCVMITVHPDTGEKDVAKQPLACLSSFRQVKNRVMFGRHVAYCLADGQLHEIAVGDVVTVCSRFSA